MTDAIARLNDISFQEPVYRDHNDNLVLMGDIWSQEEGDAYAYASGHQYVVGNAKEGLIGDINFQNGPVQQYGNNGWTNEQLLAVLIHRTEALNAKFHSDANDRAISSMKDALQAFEERTRERQQRGVEGKEIK